MNRLWPFGIKGLCRELRSLAVIAPPRKGMEMYGREVRERAMAAVLPGAGASARGVASELGFSHTTISREVAGLARAWSPRQVSLRLRADFPDDEEMRVGHETIYRALYMQGWGSLRHELVVEQALRSGRTSHRPRSRLPERRGARSWAEGAEISLRPAEVDDRRVPGPRANNGPLADGHPVKNKRIHTNPYVIANYNPALAQSLGRSLPQELD